MSTVSYNGFRLIPAPLVKINKTYLKSGQRKIGSNFEITLVGTLHAFKGSPRSGLDESIDTTGFDGFKSLFYTLGDSPPDESIGTDSRLASINRKQEALRQLFSDEGKELNIQAADGSAPLKAQVRVNDIQFSEDIWFNTSDYTVTLEADVLVVQGQTLGEDADLLNNGKILSAEEQWSIETNEGRPERVGLPRTYTVTHNLNAVGKRFYDSTGSLEKEEWKQAKDWVIPRLGFDSDIALSSGIINLPSYYQGLNHLRSENVNKLNGSYSVTEQFVMASGTSLEDFDVSVQQSNDTGLETVSIQGSIEGLETRKPNTLDSNNNVAGSGLQLKESKFENADKRWIEVSGLALTRAQKHATTTLNIQPIRQSFSKNEIAGRINYSFEYNNRPSDCIPGSISEVIRLDDSLSQDVFGEVSILGRKRGPILQDLQTKTSPRRSLNIELVMPPTIPNGCTQSDWADAFNNQNPLVNSSTSGELLAIINGADPVRAGNVNNFISEFTHNFEPKTGRFSLSKVWIYENQVGQRGITG